MVVEGERAARGMELMTREEARGAESCNRGGGGVVIVDLDLDVEGGGGDGGVGLLRASAAASRYAVRADGSTGQVEGGGGEGACWTGVEDVLPILFVFVLYCLRKSDWTTDGIYHRPKFRRGLQIKCSNWTSLGLYPPIFPFAVDNNFAFINMDNWSIKEVPMNISFPKPSLAALHLDTFESNPSYLI